MILNNVNAADKMYPSPINAYGQRVQKVYAAVPVTSGYSYSIVPTTDGWTAVALATALNEPWAIAKESIASGEEGDLIVDGYVPDAYAMATAGNTYVPGDVVTWQTSGELEPGGATFTQSAGHPVGVVITTSEDSTLYVNMWKLPGMGYGMSPSTTT